MAVPYHTHTFEIPTATKEDAEAGARNDVSLTPQSVGSAAVKDVSYFATADQGGAADTAVQSVNGKSGASIALDKTDVGLDEVDNTADADKPISSATQVALNDKASTSDLRSAAFTDVDDYATAAEGALAATAVQPGDAKLIPAGGLFGQVLVKNSNANFDLIFQTIVAATAVSYGPQDLTPEQQVQARTNIDALGAAEQAVDSAKLGGALASDYMLKTWTLTAGNGLTGGGSGATKRTLAVGEGTGITVAATSVSVDATVWRDGNKPTGAMLASVIGSMAAGALGTYALARNGVSSALSFGDNVAGSNLRFTNTTGSAVSGTGSGSWRTMGYAAANASPDSNTLFLRYA